jgi:outer membrane protein assembly factor BamA
LSLRYYHIALIFALTLLAGACGETRRIADDQYLLTKNKVSIKGDSRISKSAVQNIIKQKRNRRFLGLFRLSLWVHNLPNPEKVAEGARKKEIKVNARNLKREEKGKSPKRYNRTFGEWMMYGAGEPPVVLDSLLAMKTAEQMRLYMMKEGFFKSSAAYEIKLIEKRQRAKVFYSLETGPAFSIRNLAFDIPDPNLKLIVEEMDAQLPVKAGERFSMDRMDNQREIILRAFKNHGYYDVKKDEIFYQADSTIGNNQVDLTLGVRSLRVPYPFNTDSLVETNHLRYKLDKITVNRSYDAFQSANQLSNELDTVIYKNYTIVSDQVLRINPKIISQSVRFSTGEFYNRDLLEATYKSLSELDIFSTVNIRYERKMINNEPLLDCLVLLTPKKKQQWGFETRGTHNSGFFGVGGSVSYRNRNIFRGAEVLRIRLTGAFEAQQLLTASTSSTGETITNVQDQGTVFNTIEIGPEISITFPKFLFPIRIDRISKAARPHTIAQVSYGYQRRPDYTRNMTRAQFTYRWNESRYKTWLVTPLEVSLIKIFKSNEFQQRLDDLKDLFLNASYSDHFITAFKVSYIYNNQSFERRSSSFYYRGNAETSGNTLRSIMALSGANRDTLGSYQAFGIRFAQYIRSDHDIRFYRVHRDKSSTVFRVFGGMGLPLTNLNVLPFEKSFFAGGANGIRAWRAQTLGPGGFQNLITTFDRIGEIQLEGNIEYRKKIINVLEGALFLDMGNIWLLKPDLVRPGGEFKVNQFAGEIAFGAGIGARLNFDFFLIRFDLAMQLKDPSLDKGERWIFEPKDQYNEKVRQYNEINERQVNRYSSRINLNLGIGYPF